MEGRTLVFASHNRNKGQEAEVLLKPLRILSLEDLDFHEDIPETGSTLSENAALKVRAVFARFPQYPVFADDTGLMVEALEGRPGVYSARYAGPGAKAEDNCRKLLAELAGQDNRRAYFATAIALQIPGEDLRFFEGRVHGTIGRELAGAGGFGYDPLFVPDGYAQSFAEMDPAMKNRLSHRGRALGQLRDFLQSAGAEKS
jgi:non-canonical purine NTP pyrophosphatase, rdgB/HAM1 family